MLYSFIMAPVNPYNVSVIFAEEFGVRAGGDPTTNYTNLQTLLDSTATSAIKTILLPAGDITLSHPVIMRYPSSGLRGDPSLLTRLFGNFAGHILLAQSIRAFGLVLESSLVPGEGNSLRLGTGGSVGVNLGLEPNCGLTANYSSLTVRFFFRLISPAPNLTVFVNSGSAFGVENFTGFAVWANASGGMRVYWGGTPHDTANSLLSTNTTYYTALVYNGATVTLWLGQPGQTAVNVLSFSTTGAVPQMKWGIEQLGIGYTVAGPGGDLSSNGPPDCNIDGFELAKVVRHTTAFTCPSIKPIPDNDTLLSMNFILDDPFLVGKVGTRGSSDRTYFVPSSTETQMGGIRIGDLTFMGSNGASGPLLYDTIASKADNLNFVQCWQGFQTRGTTFASRFENFGGTTLSYFLCHTGQSENCVLVFMYPSSNAIPFYVSGPAGGSYVGVFIAPLGEAWAVMYNKSNREVNIYGGQFDDEGQAQFLQHCMIIDTASIKYSGGQLSRETAGPIAECVNGGTVHFFGCWLTPNGTPTTEIIHFVNAPDDTATVWACHFAPGGPPVSLSTNYVAYLQNGVFHAPSIV